MGEVADPVHGVMRQPFKSSVLDHILEHQQERSCSWIVSASC